MNSWGVSSRECQELSKIILPRHKLEENCGYDLHIFTDASPKAYVTGYNSEPQLLMSEARVTPLSRAYCHTIRSKVK